MFTPSFYTYPFYQFLPLLAIFYEYLFWLFQLIQNNIYPSRHIQEKAGL